MRRAFEVVVVVKGEDREKVVETRPTLRGAESSMIQWQLLIGAASADRFLDVFCREAPVENRAEG
jgi:hypothetical protein